MATINGETVPIAKSLTIADYLAEHGYDPDRVVVERNYEIVPKASFDTAVILDEDLVEILCFVGGG